MVRQMDQLEVKVEQLLLRFLEHQHPHLEVEVEEHIVLDLLVVAVVDLVVEEDMLQAQERDQEILDILVG